MTPSSTDPAGAVEALAASETPYLIGVRHHSPVVAAAVPALLDAYRPDLVLIELPEELGEWLPWLAHPDTVAPVALAAARGAARTAPRRGARLVAGDDSAPGDDEGDGPLGFYPFADFSPELAAIRWAAAAGVEVAPCDLPLTHPGWRARTPDAQTDADVDRPGGTPVADRLVLTGRDGEDRWDRWVEAAAPGSSPESVRRAALAVGWALRHDAENGGGVDPVDLAREAWMRARVAAAAGRRVAVVLGAFHAPALLSGADPAPEAPPAARDLVTSLVPYTFELLDSRSGYPAGIRDPHWQQSVFDCGAEPAGVEALASSFAVRVSAALRDAGHPAGPAESREVARLATDLARLRGLPAPGRGELVEALQTTLAQGEPTGRGRAVARAMSDVLVGDRRGRLAPGTPASGLLPAVTDLLTRLRLPAPGAAPQTVRLDPLRSPLDLRREVALRRLAVCQVPYAKAEEVVGVGGADALSTAWRVHWTPATDAAITVAGLHGVTLAQAAAGRLRAQRAREIAGGGPTAAQALAGGAAAAAAAEPRAVRPRLDDVAAHVCHGGTLEEIVAGVDLVERVRAGHVPGLAPPEGLDDLVENLYAAAVRAVDGLAGATDPADARALLALVDRAGAAGRLLRLDHALARIAATGTPLMQAAAGAVRVLLELDTPEEYGLRLASWVDAPADGLTARLQGALTVAGPLLEAGDATVTPLLDRVEELPDDDFLRRLPALRGGFDALSPAARDRVLTMVTDRLDQAGGPVLDLRDALPDDPAALAAWLAADLAGRAALADLGFDRTGAGAPALAATPMTTATAPATAAMPTAAPATAEMPTAVASEPAGDARSPGVPGEDDADRAVASRTVPPAQRWRLVLGRRRDELPAAGQRLATALDELYGAGRGEGSYSAEGAGSGGQGGGRGAGFPTVREWADELEALFGARVREEVLARAASAGRVDVALALDPESVRPSVELLHAVLSLAGGMSEANLARLRPLVARLVAALTEQLARQLRPALTGLASPRRTRRPTGVLDLPGTIRANLHTARPDDRGRLLVLPERPVFRTRSRRGVEWQLIVLTDVSGSMEPSTVWAALTASILAGVPALKTHFVTFSDGVIDLTERVDDPLALLLEVRVGGGTHIAKALRYARDLVTVPSRTMVVVISDFEEGYPLSGLVSEVRTLVGAGCALLGCASLDDRGAARYSTAVAAQLVAAGMPVAALSPLELARWVGEQVNR
ncbi:DUF5682 family protein [Luedemannella helvata]|uniref:VWA domain containing CoxE-like protein n=1 Tax=Luedemannella helvata TaxID=349315 RepID=A0ABP4W0Q4_9ACTN